MRTETRIWICPSLCGCELKIAATWVDDEAIVDDLGRKISHGTHPIGGSIKGIDLVNVCPEHLHWAIDEIDADPYFGAPGYLPLPKDRLRLTEAEKIYIGLYRIGGQICRLDTCGCQVFQVTDRSKPGVVITKDHEHHSKKCEFHTDDKDHAAALNENGIKNKTLDIIRTAHPRLRHEDILWSFNDERGLEVEASTLTVQEKGALATDLDPSVRLRDPLAVGGGVMGVKGVKP